MKARQSTSWHKRTVTHREESSRALAANMASESETIYLHRIDELPFDEQAEMFRHYPGFKLGVADDVRYYARLLLPLVRELIANDSQHNGWALTGPAIAAQTMAAANLLCRELFDLYLRERGTRNYKELSLMDIQYGNGGTASIDYANLDFAERLTLRERLSPGLVPNAEFRGRPILFVNDVCVTGAQQQAMQEYFELNGAACVRWLYLIVIDPEIGRANPKIEWQLNFAPFEDLLRMVSREQIEFTGKCMTRLMHLSVAELDQVLGALDVERRARLLELATLNGFQNLDGFEEQMKLVRSYATERTL